MSDKKLAFEAEIREQPSETQIDQEYRVGFKNPPKNTRFRKGMSGNPKGRPKRRPSNQESFHEIFSRKVTAIVDGKKTSIDGKEALFLTLRSKTSKGDLAAMQIFLNFCKIFGTKDPNEPNIQLKGLFDALMAGPVRTPGDRKSE